VPPDSGAAPHPLALAAASRLSEWWPVLGAAATRSAP
jgi:hypothetical protein